MKGNRTPGENYRIGDGGILPDIAREEMRV